MSRILVVDDEQLVRDLTVQVLERSGHDVVSAGDAKGVLELLERELVDLVVSDVVMPGLTGVELLSVLRDRHPDLPVVLMTGGSAEPERTTKALELGADGIVYKPYSHSDLIDAVRTALA